MLMNYTLVDFAVTCRIVNNYNLRHGRSNPKAGPVATLSRNMSLKTLSLEASPKFQASLKEACAEAGTMANITVVELLQDLLVYSLQV